MPGLLGYCETKEEEDYHLEQERQAYEAARDAEDWDHMQKRVAELERIVYLYCDPCAMPDDDAKIVQRLRRHLALKTWNE